MLAAPARMRIPAGAFTVHGTKKFLDRVPDTIILSTAPEY